MVLYPGKEFFLFSQKLGRKMSIKYCPVPTKEKQKRIG